MMQLGEHLKRKSEVDDLKRGWLETELKIKMKGS